MTLAVVFQRDWRRLKLAVSFGLEIGMSSVEQKLWECDVRLGRGSQGARAIGFVME